LKENICFLLRHPPTHLPYISPALRAAELSHG